MQRLCRVVWLKQASRWLQGLRKRPSSASELERWFWTFEKIHTHTHKFRLGNSRCTSRTPLDLCVSVGCYSLCRREEAKQTTTHSINLNDGVSVKSLVVKRQHQQRGRGAAGLGARVALGRPVLLPYHFGLCSEAKL